MESESITQGPRRSGRICHEPERYRFLIIDDKGIVLVDHNEPTTPRGDCRSKFYKMARDNETRIVTNV